jgi:hypothetical protein
MRRTVSGKGLKIGHLLLKLIVNKVQLNGNDTHKILTINIYKVIGIVVISTKYPYESYWYCSCSCSLKSDVVYYMIYHGKQRKQS